MSRIKPGYLKRWANVIEKPDTATRWPAFGEVTGKPATATRWPKWVEVSGKPTIVGNSGDGQVGTYVLATFTMVDTVISGETVSGSYLSSANVNGSSSSTGNLSGTWRCMSGRVGRGETTLFLRIS